MSFDATLARVLDPDGLYWRYPGDEVDDPTIVRLIEVRLDVPTAGLAAARSYMEANGWKCAYQPDELADPEQRIYFRKQQSLIPEERTAMLTVAMHAAEAADGRFWSWIDHPDETNS